jgi:AraC-like DNA-binding protein
MIIWPPSQLEDFVEHFWLQRTVPTHPATWRVVPDANPNLIVVASNPAAGKPICCTIVGPRSRFADANTERRVVTYGARLKPGTLPLITGFPAADFTDLATDVTDLYGRAGRELVNCLEHSRSASNVFEAMSAFLHRRLAGRPAPNRLSLLFPGANTVKAMASYLGLPVRTAHHRLVQQVGLAPKRLLRIQRLHHSLKLLRNSRSSWAELSAASGYADQAHLIREFQDLLGESPVAWANRSRANRSKLPICSIPPAYLG